MSKGVCGFALQESDCLKYLSISVLRRRLQQAEKQGSAMRKHQEALLFQKRGAGNL